MRKPRDFDAELKALDDKARRLKERKLVHLGELVIASGADALPVETLAGALLAAAATKDAAAKEAWRKNGATFFQHSRGDANGASAPASRGAASDGGAKPPAANAGAS